MESDAERTDAGKRGCMKTLYEIKRRPSGRFQSACKPVRSNPGVLPRTVEEEMHRWRELFEEVLNHVELSYLPEVEPIDELNIRTSHENTY